MNIQCGSSDFLETLFEQMMHISVPVLEEEPVIIIQNSALLDLPDEVLRLIVSNVPLKQRVTTVASVCKRLRTCVKASISSVEFYKEELDTMKDNSLKYFLNVYGQNITYLNFDLFRSSYIEQCTQWAWRQSVVSCISLCPKLEQLSVLVCNRHRLRDNDLIKIFKHSPCLKTLSIDAQFLNGHCFQNAPNTLEKLELEVCSRIPANVIKYIYNLKQLKTLCLSQLLCLKDSIVYGIVSNLQKLEELALIVHGDDVSLPDLTSTGLSMIGKLKSLKYLALEGIPVVTDKFFEELSDTKKPLRQTLRSLSIAFCQNFSSVGLQYLSKFVSLNDLNVEGCSKRDISLGLEAIAKNNQLQRLLLAENCNVNENSVLKVVQSSPKLRLLDITANAMLTSWNFATTLVSNCKQYISKLIVLTDNHSPWNIIPQPGWAACVKVVHVLPATIPLCEFFPKTVLSNEAPNHLTPGILSAKLRRGNRCRLLCSALVAADPNDEKENLHRQSSLSPDQRSPSPMMVYMPNNGMAALSNVMDNFPLNSINAYSNDHSFGKRPYNLMEQTNNFFSPNNSNFNHNSFDIYDPDLAALNMVSVLMADPSFDVPLKTNFAGISPSTTSNCRNGGAPRPPIQIPEQPKIRYTRGPRSKRRSAGAKIKPKSKQEVFFTPSDFPPLGSS